MTRRNENQPLVISDIARRISEGEQLAEPLRRDGMSNGAEVLLMRPYPLATPADALDLAIERGVFLIHGIIGIAEVFFRRHLVGARLSVADRGFGQRL
jgi:hypothetical protein